MAGELVSKKKETKRNVTKPNQTKPNQPTIQTEHKKQVWKVNKMQKRGETKVKRVRDGRERSSNSIVLIF